MDELTIEQKAKRYDEALKVIKGNLDALNEITETGAEVVNIQSIKNCFCRAFPELKGEDERIRKTLMHIVKGACNKYGIKYQGTEIGEEKLLSWLEKQREKANPYSGVSFEYNGHTWGMCARDYGVEILVDGEIKESIFLDKPQGKTAFETINEVKVDNQNCVKTANKVEPKFHEGDYIVTPENKVLQITSIEGTSYRFNNESSYWEICYCDEKCRLWTIQDAKDGDVLSVDNIIFIYKSILASHIVSYCNLINDVFEPYEYGRTCCEGNKYIHPATKEQRDTLEKAMADAGYEWDTENKKLKKIEQKSNKWSEEDEETFGHIEDIVNFCYCNQFVVDVQTCERVRQLVFRLKSLCFQSRFGKDDIARINEIIETLNIVQANRLRTQRMHYNKATIDKDIDWLKSLKKRVQEN